jgi:subtilisin family serine protease
MKRIQQLLILVLLVTTGTAFAQDGRYFYYYEGKKLPLQVDYTTIAISAEGIQNAQTVQRSLGTGAAQNKFTMMEDPTRQTLVTIDSRASARKEVKTYYAEMTAERGLSLAAYTSRLKAYSTTDGVITASPCFIIPGGKKMGISNYFYVQLRAKEDVDALYETAGRLNIEVMGHNKFMPLWFILACTRETGMNALDAANYFYETGLFQNTEPAFMMHDLLNSTDALFNNQWGLRNTGQFGGIAGTDIRAEQAWAITTGSPNIRTAVLDEGFEMNHPDLAANVVGTGFNASSGTVPSVIFGNHGTACAGIVSAVQNNVIGVSGVAPNSRLISVSINFPTSTYDQLANGINWAWQNGADIISNSWGGGTPSAVFNTAINNALTQGRAGRGTVVVFATANSNGAVVYPANSNPGILAVGAISPCGERKNPASCDGETFWGSNFGAELDVVAPGVLISTTDRQGANGYNTTSDYVTNFNGTSSACPHVAGVAALVLSTNPNLTAAQVNTIIEQSAQKTRPDLYAYANTGGRPNGTWNNQMGYGLVNAQQAVILAGGNNCPADIAVTANVAAPNTDNRQASNSITATNIIANGARGIYHGGGFVLLNPGFSSEFGSGLNAYIEGCSGSFVYRAAAAEEPVTYAFRNTGTGESINTQASRIKKEGLVATPNPFNNKLIINYTVSEGDTKAYMELFTPQGTRVAVLLQNNNAVKGNYYTSYDSGLLPAGTYLVVLTTNTGKQTIRVVKK